MKKSVMIIFAILFSISLNACNNDNPITCDEGFELVGSNCVKICEDDLELVDGECVDPDAIDEGIFFELIGPDSLVYEIGERHNEQGYIAKDGKEYIGESFITAANDFVVDEDNYFTETGTYEYTYTLNYEDEEIVLTRTIIVIESVEEINVNCTPLENTELISCQKIWSQYLHTVVKVTIYLPEDSLIDSVIIFDQMETIIAYFNEVSDKYKEFEGVTNVWTINQDPTAVHTLDEDLFNMIEFTLDNQASVDNAFNMALGPVLQVWHDYRENCNVNDVCEVPTMEELQAQNAYTDPSKVILNRENLTIQMDENMSIDLGGVSKGYISGILTEYLDTFDLHGYILNNGESNISIGGIHPVRETQEFILAVTDPTNPFSYYATINLREGDQLVTSGDYQQFFIVDGTFYHHIINGTTLMPERYARSVSIVTDDPALADLYSTAIFTMPIEEGITFVDSVEGLEGIWYGMDGVIHFSENFEADYLRDIQD